MINLSNFFALFELVEEDESYKKISNVLYKKFDISSIFEVENSFKRDITGSGQLFELNKYKFFIEGKGKLPFITSNDVYFLDSSIHLKYKFFKEKNGDNCASNFVFYSYNTKFEKDKFFKEKNGDNCASNFVFYSYNTKFEKDKFVKYWKEKIIDGEIIIDINDTYNESDYILPLFHCKIVNKKQLKSKWKMEIIEI